MVVLLLLAAADLAVFVWPPTDLVVVLGPWQQLTRPHTGADLLRSYPGTQLLISVYDARECPRLQQMTGDPQADCCLPYRSPRGEARGLRPTPTSTGLGL